MTRIIYDATATYARPSGSMSRWKGTVFAPDMDEARKTVEYFLRYDRRRKVAGKLDIEIRLRGA